MASSSTNDTGIEECYANITLEEEDEGGIIFDENTGRRTLLIFIGVW